VKLTVRRVLPWLLAAAFLLSISVLGINNGIDELRDVNEKTVLQQSVSISSVIYGLIGLAAGVGVLLRRRWGYFLSIAWGVVITYTGGMASHAYGETTAPVTAIAVLITALIAGIVISLANIATKPG
jgi:predicted transporter